MAALPNTVPINAPADSPAYDLFAQRVHKMTLKDLKRYWAKEVFSGRRQPPRQLATLQEVIDFIANTPGAIGYLPADTAIPATVKKITVEKAASF